MWAIALNILLCLSGGLGQATLLRRLTTLKTAWRNVRHAASVEGCVHDRRHTVVTRLAESGPGDQPIMDMFGHVSKDMLKHYSHIRMEAKRQAVEALTKRVQNYGPTGFLAGRAEI